MPDQPDSSSIAYLERVLRSALTAGGRAPDPVAGKVVVPLLGMAISIGGIDLASELSTPDPGEAAVYEVRRPAAEESAGETLPPVVLSGDLNAGAAFRAAIRYSRDGVGGVTVVGRTAAGVERCCLRRGDDGALEYVFPSPAAYVGPDAGVQAALGRWQETLASWQQTPAPWATETGNGHAVTSFAPVSNGSALGSVVPGQATSGAAPRPTAALPEVSAVAPGTGGPPSGDAIAPGTGAAPATGAAPSGDAAGRYPSAAEIAEAIQFSLMQMTVDVNLVDTEKVIRETITKSMGEMAFPPPPPPIVPRVPAVDELKVAREISGLVLDRLTRTLVEPVSTKSAERVLQLVANRLEPIIESVEERLVQALLTIEPEPEPQPAAETATETETKTISKNTLAVLDEIAEIRELQNQLLSGVDYQVNAEVRSAGAFERIDLHLQELRQFTGASRNALETLLEGMAALTRHPDSSADRLLASLGQELAEASDRIQRQLNAIEAASKRTTDEASATTTLRRLNAKLARAEDQAERIASLLGSVQKESRRPGN